MTWVKLGDTALDEPFLLGLPRGTVLMHLECVAYSLRHGTDGFIHRAALRKITSEPDPEAGAALLCSTRLSDQLGTLWAPADDGWQLFWLMDDQPTADEIAATRLQAKKRQRRRRRHTAGDHSMCDRSRCKVLLSRRDNPRDDTTPPSPPDPTPPVREERGVGGADGQEAAAAAIEESHVVGCRAYAEHRTQHQFMEGEGWRCSRCDDLRQRRDLARAIREAPSDAIRFRYRGSFDKQWGHLYGRSAAA